MNGAADPALLQLAEPAAQPVQPDAVWVELLDEHGDCRGALQLLALPATLHSEPHAANALPGVARLSRSGAVVLSRPAPGVVRAQPVGKSRVAFNGGPATALAHEFEHWACFRLGQQQYRVVNRGGNSNTPAAPAERARGRVAGLKNRLRPLVWPALHVASLLLALVGLATADWLLASSERASFARALWACRESALAALGWLGAWAVVTWRVCGSSRWRLHLRRLAVLMWVGALWSVALPLVAAGAGVAVPGIVPYLLFACGLLLAFALHLALVPLARSRRWQVAALVAVLWLPGVGREVQGWWTDDRTVPQLPATLPMSWGLDRFEPATAVLGRIDALRGPIDEARKTSKPP